MLPAAMSSCGLRLNPTVHGRILAVGTSGSPARLAGLPRRLSEDGRIDDGEEDSGAMRYSRGPLLGRTDARRTSTPSSRLLRRPLRLGRARDREVRADPAATARREGRAAGRRDDAADAGGPAPGLDDLRRGRRRRRDRRRRSGGRRHGHRRADGRRRPRPDGGLRRPDRRRLRDLAARARSRAPSIVNEPGALAWNELNTRDLGRRQGLLRRGLRLATSRTEMCERRRLHDDHRSPGTPVGGMLDIAARGVPERSRPTGWSISPSTTPTRRSRRRRATAARIGAEPIEIPVGRSRSSTTRTAPASRHRSRDPQMHG